MLGSFVIVFREAIEAGLIVGIVLTATQGVRGRGMAIAYGIAAGLFGACLVAAFAGELASLLAGSGQEAFNASVLVVAVGMLAWHNAWMARHGREMGSAARALGADVVQGRKPLTALSVVVAAAVLREGAEVVLFLTGIAAAQSVSVTSLLVGGALGIAAGAVLSGVIYLGLMAVPLRRLFAVTTTLITLLAAGLASQAVGFLQQGGFLDALATPLWDTSWLLSQDGMVGRLLQTLVGYTAQPDGAQLLAYAATIVGIVLLMRLQPNPSRPPRLPRTALRRPLAG